MNYRDQSDILLEHLLTVYEICRRADAKPDSPPVGYVPLLNAIERMRRAKGWDSMLRLPDDERATTRIVA